MVDWCGEGSNFHQKSEVRLWRWVSDIGLTVLRWGVGLFVIFYRTWSVLYEVYGSRSGSEMG
jgi:hypothetical protein